MIPSVETCLQFMEKYRMPDHIKAHSIMVEKVARLIAGGLEGAGVEIALDKVTAGALMHDIAKPMCLHTNEDHAAKGKEICIDNHFEEIAEIVGAHIRLKGYNGNRAISEKEIIYYADKRVNHDVVVSLEERLAYLLDHYGGGDDRICGLIRKNFEICKEVEKKLFAKLPFTPEEVGEMIT